MKDGGNLTTEAVDTGWGYLRIMDTGATAYVSWHHDRTRVMDVSSCEGKDPSCELEEIVRYAEYAHVGHALPDYWARSCTPWPTTPR